MAKCLTDQSQLSDDDKALVLTLAQRDLSQAEIAHIVGCHQTSVGRWLSRFESTVTVARKRGLNRALEVVDAAFDGAVKAAKDGKPEHAMELADRVGAVLKRQAEASSSQVQIVIGMPGQPIGPDPVVNIISSYQTQTESVGLTSQSLAGTLDSGFAGESGGRK
jgi:predicted transcriptional regulator